jgi:phenylacetate-coenzyme A ligase PaaK-like adenylate-forming protein
MYLASIGGLPYGNHTVQFINRSDGTGISSLDIDAFVVETMSSGTGTGNNTVVPATMLDDAFSSAGTNKLTWSDGWAKQSKSAKNNTVFLNGTVVCHRF